MWFFFWQVCLGYICCLNFVASICVMHVANNACLYLNFVNGSTYSILRVLINQTSSYVPLCSWCIFNRWLEPKNLRGLLSWPSWSWCCPMQTQTLRGLFSVVGLNKTKRRNSLALDGTLSSIMTIKMANLEPCFKWEPPSDIIKASKKATGQYNHAHRS